MSVYKKKIKNEVEKSFGIRCPKSVCLKEAGKVMEVFDYETECAWSDRPLNESAFCGKCARKNQQSIFWNLNSSLSFNHVSKFKVRSN
jgi:hypothetical protein